MEIRIENLEKIREAAHEFVPVLERVRYMLSMVRWEPVRPHLSRRYVKNWE